MRFWVQVSDILATFSAQREATIENDSSSDKTTVTDNKTPTFHRVWGCASAGCEKTECVLLV